MLPWVRASDAMNADVCGGVRRCAEVCGGVLGCAGVCGGVRGCAEVCGGVWRCEKRLKWSHEE